MVDRHPAGMLRVKPVCMTIFIAWPRPLNANGRIIQPANNKYAYNVAQRVKGTQMTIAGKGTSNISAPHLALLLPHKSFFPGRGGTFITFELLKIHGCSEGKNWIKAWSQEKKKAQSASWRLSHCTSSISALTSSGTSCRPRGVTSWTTSSTVIFSRPLFLIISSRQGKE